MPDNELEFVNKLICEKRLTARVYLCCTCLVLTLTIAILIASVLPSNRLPFNTAVGLVTGLFGLLPVPLFFIARGQMLSLEYLRGKWVAARAEGDSSSIADLKLKFDKLFDNVLDKGLFPIK